MPVNTSRIRYYYFFVAALAAFVLVLALGREHRGQYVATAIIQPVKNAPAFRPLALDDIRREILDEKVIANACDELRQAGYHKSVAHDPSVVAGDLTIQPHAERGVGGLVSVTYRGPDRDVARQMVNQLCDAFVSERSEFDQLSVSAELRKKSVEASAATEQAASRLTAARQELFLFEEEHGEAPADNAVRFPAPSDADEESEGQTPERQSSSDSASKLKELAARVSKLSEELTELERQRTSLMASKTPHHPEVVALNAKIQSLRYQLVAADTLKKEAEQRQAGGASPAETSLATDSASTTDSSNTPSTSAESIEAERQTLVAAVAEAEREFLQLSEAEQGAADAFEQLEAQATWSTKPADEVVYRSRATPLALLLISGALAMVTGSSMVFAAGTLVQTIDNATEAERVLGVPVVGTISVAAEPHEGNPRLRARIVRGAILCCEIVLGLFLFGMLLSAMLTDDFASQLRTDPLSALADGVAQLWYLIWG